MAKGREDRNAEFHAAHGEAVKAAFSEPWAGAGASMLKSSAERGTPFVNMQQRPLHGTTGKSVAKTVGALLERGGRGHTVGAGLATGRVGPRLRSDPLSVRPSMRSQILADSDSTYAEHDMTPGAGMLWHPEHIEDIEVRAAGLPPLRSTSRAGFMPGLGSVAMHKQEARAHEARHADLSADHQRASRRMTAAIGRGDKAAAAVHADTRRELGGQMKESASLAAHHNQKAGEVRDAKINALRLINANSDLDRKGHPSFGAAVLSAHEKYFDPGTKEEFYPIASQHQLADVAEVGGMNKTQATNTTAMASAQRSWRRRDPLTDEISHPNLAMAAHFAGHFNSSAASGQIADVEAKARATAGADILADRTRQSVRQHQLHVEAVERGEGGSVREAAAARGPRPIKTEVTPEHIEAHVTKKVAGHISRTLPPPGGQMGMSDSHGRQMAQLLMAKTPEEMSDVWSQTDSDKRPTFALALAATHESRSVRRQSAQAMTVDTHRAKEIEVPYQEVLGTGAGMHVTARQEIPHQPGRTVQPAYNAMAMYGTRSALRMSARNIRAGGLDVSTVTPRYAQENPWGLFAAENMQDVHAAKRNRAAGGSGQTRERAGGYYREGEDSLLRSFRAPNPNVNPDQYKNLDEDLFG